MDETFSEPQNSEKNPAAVNIEQLPEALGFTETQEIKELRDELIKTIIENNWPRFHVLIRQYQQMGEVVVEQLQGDDFAKGQIGLIVAKSLIWRDAGRSDNFGAELRDARQYARNMKFDEIVSVIEPAMLEVGEELVQPAPPDDRNQPELPDKSSLDELGALAVKFEAETQPIKVEMNNNVLCVDGRILEPTDGEAILWRALTEGKDTIMQGLEKYKIHMQSINPDAKVGLSPFEVMFLGKKKQKILTEFGMELKEDVVYNHNGAREEFQAFWQVVRACGFIPEVRIQGFKYQGWRIGLWARVPEDINTNEVEGNT